MRPDPCLKPGETWPAYIARRRREGANGAALCRLSLAQAEDILRAAPPDAPCHADVLLRIANEKDQ